MIEGAPPPPATSDAARQKADWKARLVEKFIESFSPDADEETLIVLLLAGFQQAEEDGMSEAEALLRDIAAAAPTATATAAYFADKIGALRRLNFKDRVVRLSEARGGKAPG